MLKLINPNKIRSELLSTSFNLLNKRQINFQSTYLPTFKTEAGNTFRNDPGLIEPSYKKLSYANRNNTNQHLLCDTVGGRLEVLSRNKPNDVLFKFSTTQVTLKYGEMKQRVDEMAQNLLSMGFKKGDRLAIMLPNVPETVVSLIAASQIGVIAVIMNPAYQLVEIEYMLKKTGAKGIIFMDQLKTLQHYEILKKICPELVKSAKGELNSAKLPNLKHLIVVKNKIIKDATEFKGTWSFDEDIQKRKHSTLIEWPHVEFEDPFVILFTSGTTGLPKGAVLSHFNLLNAAHSREMVHHCKIIGCNIPIFHSFGLVAGVLEPLINGSKTIFPTFFPDTLSLMKSIHDEKITCAAGPPIIFVDILNHPDRKKYNLSTLEYLLIGGSTVPIPMLNRLKSELNVKHILVGFGLTETSAAGLLTQPKDANENSKHAYESVGGPSTFSEVKIIDNDGNIAPVNTDGEICLRGYNVFKGYWDEPAKTAEIIDKNGWLHSGDIGSMNENGYVFFKSRKKEIIIRGGTNIYPAEIEAFLRTHPDILDCACFGYPDERVGEEVVVWIRLKPNVQNVTKDSIVEYCKGKIAYYKTPKYIKFVDAFPFNPNGKIQKFKMLDQMKSEMNK